jgi:hypothetical protein
MSFTTRRQILRATAAAGLALPLWALRGPRTSRAASGTARRAIFFYFPDGVVGPSQDGEPSQWHCTGSENSFALSSLLAPLGALKDECLFVNGLTMGAADSGSHPGGAKKLLTAVDGGNGTSLDQALAQTAGKDAPFRHLYLGAMAAQNSPSGDKFISYPSPGQTQAPEDDPRAAFTALFGAPGMGGGGMVDPAKQRVLAAAMADVESLRAGLGEVERAKLDLHLESLHELEKRLQGPMGGVGGSCDAPAIDSSGFGDGQLYDSSRFPAILRAQTDLMVLAMACGLTRVGVIQGSQHTSELVMSRFEGTEMFTPDFDMRSHQASHYGPNHDPNKPEFAAYVKQRRWWVEQFAYLLQQLKDRPDPEGDGSMLDTSIVLLCSEVCDGNTHLHDNMPFVLAGRAGGALSPGRLLSFEGRRHADLLLTIAHAMGETWTSFGEQSSGPLPGVLA